MLIFTVESDKSACEAGGEACYPLMLSKLLLSTVLRE